MFNELLRMIFCENDCSLFAKKNNLHRKDGITRKFGYFSILMSHKYMIL